MANIYLIRHGQASFGANNYDNLSSLGHSQARHLGEYFNLRLIQPSHVICGNMTRHQQTRDACLSTLSPPLLHESLQISTPWNEFDHENVIAVYRPDLATPDAMKYYLQQQASPTRAFIELFSRLARLRFNLLSLLMPYLKMRVLLIRIYFHSLLNTAVKKIRWYF